jgi:hypothetical protein
MKLVSLWHFDVGLCIYFGIRNVFPLRALKLFILVLPLLSDLSSLLCSFSDSCSSFKAFLAIASLISLIHADFLSSLLFSFISRPVAFTAAGAAAKKGIKY